MIKGVIFDLDGTLIDDEKYTVLSKIKIGKEYGYNIKEEDARKTLGLSNINSDRLMKSIYGEDVPTHLFREERKREILEDMKMNGIVLKKGAKELLDYLDQHGYKKVVCTSTVKTLLDEYRKYGDFLDRFNSIISGDMVTNGKPNPEIFLLGAQSLGLSVDECLVVEDANSGINAALAGGFKSILIPDVGYIDPMVAKKTIVKESLFDVIEYLEKINQK